MTNLILRNSSWTANTVLYMGHLKLYEVVTAKTTIEPGEYTLTLPDLGGGGGGVG